MVSQQQETSSLTEEQQILELAKTVEVDDTTQPEVDAAADTETQTEQQEGSVDQPEQGGAQPRVEQTAQAVPAQPADGVDLSQIPEWRQAQSKYDQRIAALEQQVHQTEARREQAAEKQVFEATIEADLRTAEQRLAPDLGEEEAKRQVRSQANVQAVREFHEAKAMALRSQTSEQSALNDAEQMAKIKIAGDFSRQYGLEPEDQSLLMQTPDPQAMEAFAKRLGGGRSAQAVRNAVPPETAETTLEAGESSAPASGSFWSLIDSAQDKHWSDMNAAERDAVTRVAEGRIPE